MTLKVVLSGAGCRAGCKQADGFTETDHNHKEKSDTVKLCQHNPTQTAANHDFLTSGAELGHSELTQSHTHQHVSVVYEQLQRLDTVTHTSHCRLHTHTNNTHTCRGQRSPQTST